MGQVHEKVVLKYIARLAGVRYVMMDSLTKQQEFSATCLDTGTYLYNRLHRIIAHTDNFFPKTEGNKQSSSLVCTFVPAQDNRKILWTYLDEITGSAYIRRHLKSMNGQGRNLTIHNRNP